MRSQPLETPARAVRRFVTTRPAPPEEKRAPKGEPAPAVACRPRLPSLVEGAVVAGKYALVRRLRDGGMGSLWLAHREDLDVDCALKVIRADVSEADRECCEGRLVQEARAAARLGHPAIVRVFDVGRAATGEPFLVMELLDGEDLAALVARRRVSPEKAVQLLLPIVHALSFAHGHGVVHRDVKPENIYLVRTLGGTVQPKLIDFGVARVVGHRAERLTADGAIMGTPGYMSPEQARGSEADARSDLWAVCVILWELVCGCQPFGGDNYNAQLRSIIEDDPPRFCASGVEEPGLEGIVARGLAKEPAARWPTMHALGVALAVWLRERGYTSDAAGAALDVQWMPPTTSAAAPSDVIGGDSLPPEVAVHHVEASPSPRPSAPKHGSPPRLWLWVGGGIVVLAVVAASLLVALAERRPADTGAAPAAAPTADPADRRRAEAPPSVPSTPAPAASSGSSIPIAPSSAATSHASGGGTAPRPRHVQPAPLLPSAPPEQGSASAAPPRGTLKRPTF
ncbi:MAG: serine/threonine protein kinase [Myxococcales bacterium]|nr:serine/threonine protein kinase [Myxococcales bacterium]